MSNLRQEAYNIAFDKWNDLGAADANNKEFSDGAKVGFNENIDRLRDVEFAAGQKDEELFFSKNAVLKFTKADLIPLKDGRFYPGSELMLNLELINFGQVASKASEVKIKVTPLSSNIKLLSNEVQKIVSLPEKANIKVKNVTKLKLSENAKTGSEIALKVTAFLPNGLKQTLFIKKKIDFHIGAELSIKGKDEPHIRGLFWITLTHELEVTIKNNSRSELKDNLTIML